jgi:hypothetical protein
MASTWIDLSGEDGYTLGDIFTIGARSARVILREPLNMEKHVIQGANGVGLQVSPGNRSAD